MLDTPVLLIAFNRPEITKKVFEKIRNVSLSVKNIVKTNKT